MVNLDGSKLRHLNLSYDPKDSENSCLQLLKALSPAWTAAALEDEVKYKQFTDGITNVLILATDEGEGEDNAVLIRSYGNGTDTMIDRAKELHAHALLASKGLAAPLYATFDNGFMYGYIKGEACTAEDFHDPRTSLQIAKRLGQCHGSLDVSAISTYSDGSAQPKPNLWMNAVKWIDLLPADTRELQKRNDTFKAELEFLMDLLGGTPGLDGRDYVFSHTDLLCGNVILEPERKDGQSTREVTFIDFEYAIAAPPAFDVANLFAEWAGPDGELSWMPSKSQRLAFIEAYVGSFRQFSGKRQFETTTEEAVTQIYDQVERFRGLPGFYWGIWGMIQASISDIDFDFASYAQRRHSEYWAWKGEYDGSRAREGREMPVREQAWAKE